MFFMGFEHVFPSLSIYVLDLCSEIVYKSMFKTKNMRFCAVVCVCVCLCLLYCVFCVGLLRVSMFVLFLLFCVYCFICVLKQQFFNQF